MRPGRKHSCTELRSLPVYEKGHRKGMQAPPCMPGPGMMQIMQKICLFSPMCRAGRAGTPTAGAVTWVWLQATGISM